MGQPGYVYVMRLDESTETLRCPHKIGLSKLPTIRQDQLGILMPYSVSLILVMKVDNMREAEQRLHRRYARSRLNGEWFRLTKIELAQLVLEAGGTGEGCVCWDYNPECPFAKVCGHI